MTYDTMTMAQLDLELDDRGITMLSAQRYSAGRWTVSAIGPGWDGTTVWGPTLCAALTALLDDTEADEVTP
jgi:hypothetical protein